MHTVYSVYQKATVSDMKKRLLMYKKTTHWKHWKSVKKSKKPTPKLIIVWTEIDNSLLFPIIRHTLEISSGKISSREEKLTM